MEDKSFRTIKGQAQCTTIIEKSKFICRIRHVENEDEAKDFVAKIKKQEAFATHNCYAYVADEKGVVRKFSDDGEPQGTAGFPMLNALCEASLRKAVAVVTRYFGGIKLGTGGLARAYGGAVRECLKSADTVKVLPCFNFVLTTDFALARKLSAILLSEKINTVKTEYFENVKFSVAVVCDSFDEASLRIDKVIDIMGGKIVSEFISEGFYEERV